VARKWLILGGCSSWGPASGRSIATWGAKLGGTDWTGLITVGRLGGWIADGRRGTPGWRRTGSSGATARRMRSMLSVGTYGAEMPVLLKASRVSIWKRSCASGRRARIVG